MPSRFLKLLLWCEIIGMPAFAAPSNEIIIEPVSLTEAAGSLSAAVNVGAVVSDTPYAEGLQLAADIWGVNLDLFVTSNPVERQKLADRLLDAGEYAVIHDTLPGEDWTEFRTRAGYLMTQCRQTGIDPGKPAAERTKAGYAELRATRAAIVTRLPKLVEVMPIAAPVSPLPDSFFTGHAGPRAEPLVRMDRAFDSSSAPPRARVGVNAVTVAGHALERTGDGPDAPLLLNLESGLLGVQPAAGATDPAKISTVLTGAVVAIRGPGSSRRDVALEHNASDPSQYASALHAPDEFERLLGEWRRGGRIAGFRRLAPDRWELQGWEGADRTLRAGFFAMATAPEAKLEAGTDITGRRAIDYTSSLGVVQQLVEEAPGPARRKKTPKGGRLTTAGATAGGTVGVPLADLLIPGPSAARDFPASILAVEGGFLAVTPAAPPGAADLNAPVERIDIDLRGPLTLQQTVSAGLAGGKSVVFRRTVLDPAGLDLALGSLESLGLLEGWRYEGVRGRGLGANVVFDAFLGRRRMFMSSLFLRRLAAPPARPRVRFYVDHLHRLAFTHESAAGWAQEFVEIPVRVPPVPRDVVLTPVPTALP